MASITFFLRSGLTGVTPLTTAETVEVETPARRATSRIVYFFRSCIFLPPVSSGLTGRSCYYSII